MKKIISLTMIVLIISLSFPPWFLNSAVSAHGGTQHSSPLPAEAKMHAEKEGHKEGDEHSVGDHAA